jgi:hypothetical protein
MPMRMIRIDPDTQTEAVLVLMTTGIPNDYLLPFRSSGSDKRSKGPPNIQATGSVLGTWRGNRADREDGERMFMYVHQRGGWPSRLHDRAGGLGVRSSQRGGIRQIATSTT